MSESESDVEEEVDSESSYQPSAKLPKRINYTKHHKVRMSSLLTNHIPESINTSNINEIVQLFRNNQKVTTVKCLELIGEATANETRDWDVIKLIINSEIIEIFSDLLNSNDNDIIRLVTKCIDDITDCGYIKPFLKYEIHKKIVKQIHHNNTLIQIDSLSILGNIALNLWKIDSSERKQVFFSSDINILDDLLMETHPTKHYDILYFISFLMRYTMHFRERQHIPKILQILNVLIMYDDGEDIIEEAVKMYSECGIMDSLMDDEYDAFDYDISSSINGYRQKLENNKTIFNISTHNWNKKFKFNLPIEIINLCRWYFDVFHKRQIQTPQFDFMNRFTRLLVYNTNIQAHALNCIDIITTNYVIEDKYCRFLIDDLCDIFMEDTWYDTYYGHIDIQEKVFTILQHITDDKCVYIRKSKIIPILIEIVLSDRQTIDEFQINEAAFGIVCECLNNGDNEMRKYIFGEGFISTFFQFVSKVSSTKIIHSELVDCIERTLRNMTNKTNMINDGDDIKVSIRNESKCLTYTDLKQENSDFISRCTMICQL